MLRSPPPWLYFGAKPVHGECGMHDIGTQMLSRLQGALPEAKVYWEKEPSSSGLKGSVLTAELKNRKFTMQFYSETEKGAGTYDSMLIDQVVDDFVDFFARSIYPKEKFTRII
jgi:hypothetical protein